MNPPITKVDEQERERSPAAPAGPNHASTPALPQLLAQLAFPLWGLTALSLADETGLLDALDERRSLDVLAARAGLTRSQIEAVGDVLVAIGVAQRDADELSAAPVLHPALAGPARRALRAELRSNLLQSASLLADARSGGVPASWVHTDPVLLNAQGDRSAGHLLPLWVDHVFPALDGLPERLARPQGRFLDVGVGVAGLAIGLCRRYPGLTGVGIDPLDAALTQARRNVMDAGLSDRIELREGHVEDLAEESSYDLVHVPAPFLSEDVLERGVQAALCSLRPGGWTMVQAVDGTGIGLQAAVLRLWCTLWGGDPIAPERVEQMLQRAGYEDTKVVRVEGGPPIAHVGGRRPPR